MLPKMISPRKNVPVVITTALERYSVPIFVRTPLTSSSSIINSSTIPCMISKLSSSSITFFISCWYSTLSACARNALTAGPLPVFNIRIWICVLSIVLAIWPPNASISRTTIPLAGPPTDGLHGIKAILSKLIVNINVLAPRLADAKPASIPA